MVDDSLVKHYHNLFAWTGLYYLLTTESKESFQHDLPEIQEMLKNIYKEAYSYTGNNEQISKGYKDIVSHVAVFNSFCKNLEDLSKGENIPQ